jgi:hypothetical protein
MSLKVGARLHHSDAAWFQARRNHAVLSSVAMPTIDKRL